MKFAQRSFRPVHDFALDVYAAILDQVGRAGAQSYASLRVERRTLGLPTGVRLRSSSHQDPMHVSGAAELARELPRPLEYTD